MKFLKYSLHSFVQDLNKKCLVVLRDSMWHEHTVSHVIAVVVKKRRSNNKWQVLLTYCGAVSNAITAGVLITFAWNVN